MSNKIFYTSTSQNRYNFNTIEELQELADAENQDIDSFYIQLNSSCHLLRDEDYNRLDNLDNITTNDIRNYYEK